MSKIPITRDELGARVLAAIHERPGIKEIAITLEGTSNVGMTWHVTIIDSGDAEIELACTVAKKVQEELDPLFEVTD